jgi:hypothetical protein
MKATTLHHHENTLRACVVPKFGARKITDINREDAHTADAPTNLGFEK